MKNQSFCCPLLRRSPRRRQVILTAGGTPVGGYLPECMVPESFDGLLLGGGGDLDPIWYGEANWASTDRDPARDSVEFRLVQKALLEKRPILGICRGIQILNAFLGSSLIQDLGTAHSMVDGDYRLHTVCTKKRVPACGAVRRKSCSEQRSPPGNSPSGARLYSNAVDV